MGQGLPGMVTPRCSWNKPELLAVIYKVGSFWASSSPSLPMLQPH